MRRRLLCLALTVIALAVLGAGAAAAGTSRARGDVRVLGLVPAPGYPALPHLMGGNLYEGTYDNPYGSSQPSKVFEFSPAGQMLRSWTVLGQDVSQPHGVQVAANDSRGRLLLLDKTSGRIIRLDPRTNAQTLYARVPDLPLCSAAAAGQACSPATVDQTPMPDYAAWGPDGSLYVTDYQQAVIWRVPPAGGKPVVFFSSPLLDGGPFGTACITLLGDHRTLLFDQASNGGQPSSSNPQNGKLYELPILPGDKPGTLHELWSSGAAEAPDGCAVAASGHVYIAMVGLTNQIVELDRQGNELMRFGQAYTGNNNSSVPFDSPSGVAFLGTRLIIANQSYFADSSANQALLDMETGEAGAPVYMPRYAGVLPPKPKAKGKHKATAKHRTKAKHRAQAKHRAKHKRRAKPKPKRARR